MYRFPPFPAGELRQQEDQIEQLQRENARLREEMKHLAKATLEPWLEALYRCERVLALELQHDPGLYTEMNLAACRLAISRWVGHMHEQAAQAEKLNTLTRKHIADMLHRKYPGNDITPALKQPNPQALQEF